MIAALDKTFSEQNESAFVSRHLEHSEEEEMDFSKVYSDLEHMDFEEWRKTHVKENLAKVDYGMIWLDIEYNPSPNCSWADFNFESNCEYIKELIQAV